MLGHNQIGIQMRLLSDCQFASLVKGFLRSKIIPFNQKIIHNSCRIQL